MICSMHYILVQAEYSEGEELDLKVLSAEYYSDILVGLDGFASEVAGVKLVGK